MLKEYEPLYFFLVHRCSMSMSSIHTHAYFSFQCIFIFNMPDKSLTACHLFLLSWQDGTSMGFFFIGKDKPIYDHAGILSKTYLYINATQ